MTCRVWFDSRSGPACESNRSEEHTSELQSHSDLVCRLLLEKKNIHAGTDRLMEARWQASYTAKGEGHLPQPVRLADRTTSPALHGLLARPADVGREAQAPAC